MKNTLLKATLMIVLGLSLNSCTKKSTSTSNNNNNTSTTPAFSATMNGTATTFTTVAGTNGSSYLEINESATGSSGYSIQLWIAASQVKTGTYSFVAPGGSGSYAIVQTTSSQYWATGSGTLTITAATGSLITGTFSFTATGSGNMSVTNGSFANIGY